MPTAPPWLHPELPARFLLIVEGLCRAAAARLGVTGADREATGRLMVLLWSRLHRVAERFAALAARRGFPRRSPALAPLAGQPASGKRRHLPHRFGWLVRLVPEAACYGTQLQHLLATPEMAALLAASPTARRLLQPLCRMLAQPSVHPAPTGSPPPAAPARPPGTAARGAAARSRTPPARAHVAWPPIFAWS
jgi:hypothetical protein